MPKFKITTEIGQQREAHEEPVEFPHVEAARRDAQVALTEMYRDGAPHRKRADFGIMIEDDFGNEVYKAVLHFEELQDDDLSHSDEGTASPEDRQDQSS